MLRNLVFSRIKMHFECFFFVVVAAKKYQYFYAISSDVDAVNPGTVIMNFPMRHCTDKIFSYKKINSFNFCQFLYEGNQSRYIQ